MSYIRASSPRRGVVVYQSEDGSETIREGGSRSWRNNNPGNIEDGRFTQRCGSIGTDGRFAIFPDEELGLRCISRLLLTPSYKKLTLKRAILRYAPSNENDAEAYAQDVSDRTGIGLDQIVGELSDDQRDRIAAAIQIHEGWRAGREYPKPHDFIAELPEEADQGAPAEMMEEPATLAGQLGDVISTMVDKLAAVAVTRDGRQVPLFFPEGIELIQVSLQGSSGDPKLPSLTASATVSGLKTFPNTQTDPAQNKPKPAPFLAGSPAVPVEETEFEEDFGTLESLDIAGLATVEPPKAVPADDPFPFAQSDTPPGGRHWPLRTRHPLRNVVSYVTRQNQVVGSAGRMFLGARPKGRYHVAIDLYAYENDEVVACEDGTIVAFYPFYHSRTGEMTYALLIGHASFVINYGEVKAASPRIYGWAVGDRVSSGQPVARVSSTAMTHFETYVPGTVRNEQWYRAHPHPPHLLNPTAYLLETLSA